MPSSLVARDARRVRTSPVLPSVGGHLTASWPSKKEEPLHSLLQDFGFRGTLTTEAPLALSGSPPACTATW